MKIRPMGPELFYMDGRMERRTDTRIDMMKLIVAFRNFANAPKNALSTYPILSTGKPLQAL
jgi:hypothetical protein